MNALARRIGFWRKPRAQVSRIETVLPRIRAIREQCDWQPLTSAAAVERRRERVHHARRRIVYNPVPYERGLDFGVPLKRRWWLRLAGGIGVLCAIVLILILNGTEPSISTSQSFNYQLPGVPPFLSEQLALDKATESLSKVALDWLAWQPIQNRPKSSTFAPDGRPEVFLQRFNRANANQGLLQFGNPRAIGVWTVTVMLDRDRVTCSVSPP